MKKLQIEDEAARRIYKTATAELKTILEQSFTKEFFSQKITDRIKTWEDVLDELKLNEEDIIPYCNPRNKKHISQNAFAKLQTICEVFNEGWVPNFNNNEYKYYCWFEKKASGWCFDSSVYSYDCTILGFGLYLKNKELSDYVGTQFLDVFKEYLPE